MAGQSSSKGECSWPGEGINRQIENRSVMKYLPAIDPDISRAATLPSRFYRDIGLFEAAKDKIWARAWHFAGDEAVCPHPGYVFPFTLLPGVLDEPLLLSRTREDRWHALSNVCTHRGKILVEAPGPARQLSCGYHGRCFRLDGAFKSMPGFEGAANFPSPADDLPPVSHEQWLGMNWVSLSPYAPFSEITAPIAERVGFLPLQELELMEDGVVDYQVEAHWALYCDNYLEGFHVPFVHPALNEALDFGAYDYETFGYCSLQIGIAREGEPVFDLPEGHPDAGRAVYAYYFFLFPNLMFNFYPWGLSLNLVEPQASGRTKVRFRAYRFRGTPYRREDNSIDQTELEDEAVVESVQQGIQARLYGAGRFSPQMERCVHHFHRLVADFMNA